MVWRGLHAEPIFLEQMASWKLDKERCYKVTCFISWSPCEACANETAFLRENSHGDLRIFAARICEHQFQDCKAGRSKLKEAGAEVAMMTSKEFEHCWESFVDHQDRPFLLWDDLDVQSEELSKKLEGILQNQDDWWMDCNLVIEAGEFCGTAEEIISLRNGNSHHPPSPV